MSQQDYTTIVSRNLYSRPLEGGDKKSEGLVEVVMFRRFTEPSGEGVVSYILQEGERIWKGDTNSPKQKKVDPKRDNLRVVLRDLPEKIRDHLRNRDENLMKFFGNFISSGRVKEGGPPSSYISLDYATLSQTRISRGRQEEIYKTITELMGHDRKGYEWGTTLDIKSGVLPSREIIDALVRERTSRSDPFNVSIPNYSKEKMMQVLSLVYAQLPNAKAIEDVPDETETLVAIAAVRSMIKMHELLMMNSMEISIGGLLEEILKDGMPHKWGSGNGTGIVN